MVVGVERFGDPARTNLDQPAVREALYSAQPEAFVASGIGRDSCVSEDRVTARSPDSVGVAKDIFDLYTSIYSHVQISFKSLPSLLRRTSS
jgi:hypothetical protein